MTKSYFALLLGQYNYHENNYTKGSHLIYRKDIDGLRAFAVMAVVLYHLGFHALSGGFIGVDIFFVISGYLITQSIQQDIKKNIFTIKSFYIKRIRRIIPALFTITFATIVAALFILPIYELEEFALSVMSVSTFSSNIFFWQNLDYFSVSSELKPLLHMWSLGIEEQFYILFPLLMLFLAKLKDNKIIFLLFLFFMLSFLLNISSFAIANPTANFFLPITRFWELLAGSMLAISIKDVEHKNILLNNILAFFGFMLVILPIFLLDKYSIFPGYNALYPVLGASIIIYTGYQKQTYISGILSSQIIRYVGLISYSMYLWHWPIIALSKHILIGDFSLRTQVFILLLVFILSSFSYHFIEQPFRKKHTLKKFLQLKSGFLSLSVLLATASAILIYVHLNHEPNKSSVNLDNSASCFTNTETLESTKRCSFGNINSDKIFILYGDSHAHAMLPVFKKLAIENNYRGIVLSLTGCPPLFNVFRLDNDKIAQRCKGIYSSNMEKFLEFNKDQIDHIFLVSRWTLYEKGWIVNGRLNPVAAHFLSDDEIKSKNASDSAKVLKKALVRTVDKLSRKLNIKTSILSPIPVLNGHIKNPKTIRVTKKEYIKQRYFTDNILKSFKNNNLVNTIDPINIFCSTETCIMYKNNIPLYIDDNHVSKEGALKFFDLLDQALKQ